MKNIARLRELLDSVDEFRIVRSRAEYRAAREAGKHAAFIGIQGGNALDRDPFTLDLIPDNLVLRITLVHLSTSKLGVTSSPLKVHDGGLTDDGRTYVKRLNEKKIFVDLAHISKKGFWDAVAIHDKSQPLIVTHTGVSGVHEHWRNLDDDQLRAVADTGGTIGVMYQSSFLGPGAQGKRAEAIVRHLEHIVSSVGEDHASLGSDWDGAITPPRDMPTCLELPRLVRDHARSRLATRARAESARRERPGDDRAAARLRIPSFGFSQEGRTNGRSTGTPGPSHPRIFRPSALPVPSPWVGIERESVPRLLRLESSRFPGLRG